MAPPPHGALHQPTLCVDTSSRVLYLNDSLSWKCLSKCQLFFFNPRAFLPKGILKIIFILILLQLSQFFPLYSLLPIPPPAPTVNLHTVVHVRGSLIHVPCLAPASFFHHYLPPPSPQVTFSLFHDSMPVVLFCSLLYYSLDSSYRWDHMVFAFHWLAYFT